MILIDQYGNMRRPARSGKRAIKRSESAGSRAAKAESVRRARRARVLYRRG